MPTRDPHFLSKIRELSCLACGKYGPSEAHHILSKRSYGDDWFNVIPLCAGCHRGYYGWHGGRKTFLEGNSHVLEHLKKLGWIIELDNKVFYHPEYRDGPKKD